MGFLRFVINRTSLEEISSIKYVCAFQYLESLYLEPRGVSVQFLWLLAQSRQLVIASVQPALKVPLHLVSRVPLESRVPDVTHATFDLLDGQSQVCGDL